MTPEHKDALMALLDQLSAADLDTVTRFAEFLHSRSGDPRGDAPVPAASSAPATVPAEIPEPQSIPRPAEEKVVAAVKRLSKTYYMLDRKTMLGVTSDLVTQHVLQGRDAAQVIDELEAVFEQQYRQLRDAGDG